jgi:hypothetical protein
MKKYWNEDKGSNGNEHNRNNKNENKVRNKKENEGSNENEDTGSNGDEVTFLAVSSKVSPPFSHLMNSICFSCT